MEVVNRLELLSNELCLLNLLGLGYLSRRRPRLMRAPARTAATDPVVVREWPGSRRNSSTAASDMQARTPWTHVRAQPAA